MNATEAYAKKRVSAESWSVLSPTTQGNVGISARTVSEDINLLERELEDRFIETGDRGSQDTLSGVTLATPETGAGQTGR